MIRNLFDGKDLGSKMAKTMIDNGAMQILEDAQKIAFKDEMPQRL